MPATDAKPRFVQSMPLWLLLSAMAALAVGGALVGVTLDDNDLRGGVAGSGIGSGLAMLLFAYVKARDRRRREPAGCGTNSPAANRYAAAMGVWMAVYCFDIVLISWVLNIETWPVWARAIAAVTPALPIGGVIHALMVYVKEETDEYQRMLTTRAVLIATGLTFFVLTAWGFLELYIEQTPHFPVAFAMTPFWLFFGFASWWVRR